MIKVSIIVPVYNVAEYILRCLSSLRNQTYKNIEVIFVDDCGVDGSMDIITEFCAENNCQHWQILHHNKNRGLSAARNTGLAAASGEYVYFLDSDDDITLDCIETLVQPLTEREVDMVIGDYNIVGEGGYSPLLLPQGLLLSNAEILKAYAEGKWYVMAWNKLCRREFLQGNNLYFKEGLIHEDVLWTFQVACKAESMYVVKQPTYNYYVRSSSIMTSMSIEKDLRIYLDVFDEIVNFVKTEGRQCGAAEYCIIEGKKSGIMYSLMQKGEYSLYRKAYPRFCQQVYISPYRAWRAGVINLPYMLRDLHYALPEFLGRMYKRVFYMLVYRLRAKRVDGAVWR